MRLAPGRSGRQERLWLPVERVFSLMRRTFGQEQDMALADIVRTSLMLQYNYRDHNSARASDRRACQV